MLFKGCGSIQSITEGYTYIYIGSEKGGLKRFNLYGKYFDNPITTAQGLKDNTITAVHFDKSTGFIWAASPNDIQYSFSREGDWYPISLKSMGLSHRDKILQIGSSNNYIWLKARSSYVKLDHNSGTLIGIYPRPDELEINWSSTKYEGQKEIKKILNEYVVMDSWTILGDELIDKLGRRVDVSTGYIAQHDDVYIGLENGIILHGSRVMETLIPIYPDIPNDDISALYNFDNHLWIGSQNYLDSKGITKLDINSLETSIYTFEETINMQPTSIRSLQSTKKQLFAGGNDVLLYFDMDRDYWRTLDESQGAPGGVIWDICLTEPYLWMGSSKGLRILNTMTLTPESLGIENFFHDVPVYDFQDVGNEIWIGSNVGLFIYSNNDPKLIRASDYAKSISIANFTKVTAIEYFRDDIYVAGRMGIAKFDLKEKEWTVIARQSQYDNNIVYSMAINDKFIFLGTREGLTRINKRSGLVRDYNYTFIGSVNDIFLDKTIIWLGTSTGLIKFKWKKDL